MDETFDVDNVFNYWIKSAEKDAVTMSNLFNTKDYQWSLFIGHIVLEKLLKASIVSHSANHAPFTHNLTKLAQLTNFEFSEEFLDWLDTISTFNINARYDSHKEAFYKKCTLEFTSEWILKITTLKTWIKEKL